MAAAVKGGLRPSEIAFLCEMETVTVMPRQRLERLDLLGGATQALQPPQRASLPLWLALLLKRQRRANIVPPPWLHPTSLEAVLKQEVETSPEGFSSPPPLPHRTSPPFALTSTADAPAEGLPYHWLELGEILLEAAADDLLEPDHVRRLLRDLREVRMAKMRTSVAVLDGGSVSVKGVGAMEVGEGRAFIAGVVDGLRKIGASREQARKEREDADGGDDDEEDGDLDYAG
ncbi:MAG: DNA replication protein psf2 [Thelocarpon superellum]|nr:MAG: DNA replication protein psf2 [Thelocarpon superellum]